MAAGVVVELVKEPALAIIESVTALEENAFGRGGLNEWHLPVIARQGRLYVARANETKVVVGAASLIRSWETGIAFLFDLAVAREWRRRGVGRRLMAAVVEELKRDGIRCLELTVAPENGPALALYNGLGMTKAAYLPEEYGGGADRILLRLELGNGNDER